MSADELLRHVLSELAGRTGFEPKPGSDGWWNCRCPAHDDQEPSLGVKAGARGIILKCQAGCSAHAIADCIGLATRELFYVSRSPKINPRKSGGEGRKSKLSLPDLAAAKGLPVAYLISLGLRQIGNAVEIPYYLASGAEAPRQRRRSAILAKAGSRWTGARADGDLVPYGLWGIPESPAGDNAGDGTAPPARIPDPRARGAVLIVEGESDCWTLWHAGFPALGLPGATAEKCLKPEHLMGVKRAYIVAEADKAGHEFPARVAIHLDRAGWRGECLAVAMPDEAKDPNALWLLDQEAFPVALRELIAAAESVDLKSPSLGGLGGETLKNYDFSDQDAKEIIARHINGPLHDVLSRHGRDLGRIGENLFYAPAAPLPGVDPFLWLDSTPAVFGLLHALYPDLRWRAGNQADKRGVNFPGRAEFAAQLRARVTGYLGTSLAPFEPARPEVFTRWQAPAGYAPAGKMLARFLDFFNPATATDAALLQAFVLTLFWGGPPGARPLFIVAPADSGSTVQSIGKTELARQCAALCGGTMELALSRKASFVDDLAKQALEACNLGRRVALLDNLTGTVRDDSLTDIITAKLIEGRAAYAKRGRRANLVTWVITTNELAFAADLASRAVVIRLAPCNRRARPLWLTEIGDFINAHHRHVAADCITRLRDGKRTPITREHTRFPVWDAAVLACLESADDCLAAIAETAKLLDSDAAEIEEFLQALAEIEPGPPPNLNPDPFPLELRMRDLVKIWREAMGRNMTPCLLGRILNNAANRGHLRGLRRKWPKKNGSPWLWEPWVVRAQQKDMA